MSGILPPPFPIKPPMLGWLVNPILRRRLDAVRKDRRFSNMGVALVDLTFSGTHKDYSGWISFEGWNTKKQVFAASLVKIAAMFAAFRLRESLQAAAGNLRDKTSANIFSQVEAAWGPIVATFIPEGTVDFPDLATIFDISGSPGAWKFTFTQAFEDEMTLMIAKSKNEAAAFVTKTVGFKYLNGALKAEGLYDRGGAGGLWLGKLYGGKLWKRDPIGGTSQGATAESVGRFLGLLETDRLVNARASKDMRELMGKAGSWFGNKVSEVRSGVDYYAKMGVDGIYADCAVIKYNIKGKFLRYAAVGLTAHSANALEKLIVLLDEHLIQAYLSAERSGDILLPAFHHSY